MALGLLVDLNLTGVAYLQLQEIIISAYESRKHINDVDPLENTLLILARNVEKYFLLEADKSAVLSPAELLARASTE